MFKSRINLQSKLSNSQEKMNHPHADEGFGSWL
jgi:hypothetical protein